MNGTPDHGEYARTGRKLRSPFLNGVAVLRSPTGRIVLATVFVVALTAVIAVATVLVSRERVLAAELDSLQMQTRLLASSIQRVVFGADVLASSIEQRLMDDMAARGETGIARIAGTKAMYDHMLGLLEHAVDLEALAVLDERGKSLVQTRAWPTPPIDFSDRSYFIALRDNPGLTLAVSERIRSRVSGQDIIILARRLNGPNDKFHGVVFAVIAVSRFERLLQSAMHDDATRVMLFRRDGTPLVRQSALDSDGDGTVNSLPGIWEVVRSVTTRAEKAIFRTQDVSPRHAPSLLVAAENIRGYPLTLVSTHPEKSVLAEWWALARIVFAFAAVALLSLIPLSIAYVRTSRAQARAAAAAQAASRAKSDFLSSMSHELRTPLNAVIGFAQLIQYNQAKEPLTPGQQVGIADILSSGKHLLALINDVLDLAKIESGKTEVTIEDVTPLSVVDMALPLVTTAAADRGIIITIADPLRHAPALRADRMRLKQVLLNLLSNAVKYNRDGGRVNIDYEAISEGWGRVSIRDTGNGIPPDKQSRLFHAFDRLDAEQLGIDGTGIGLVLCRELAERMGGRIGVESQPGAGSCFWLELPLSRSGLPSSAANRGEA